MNYSRSSATHASGKARFAVARYYFYKCGSFIKITSLWLASFMGGNKAVTVTFRYHPRGSNRRQYHLVFDLDDGSLILMVCVRLHQYGF